MSKRKSRGFSERLNLMLKCRSCKKKKSVAGVGNSQAGHPKAQCPLVLGRGYFTICTGRPKKKMGASKRARWSRAQHAIKQSYFYHHHHQQQSCWLTSRVIIYTQYSTYLLGQWLSKALPWQVDQTYVWIMLQIMLQIIEDCTSSTF